jgi:hypothetical protein
MLDLVCPVCGVQVTQLVRVGDFLLAEPCTHHVTDLRRFDWYQAHYVRADGTRGPYKTRRERKGE